MAYLTDEAMVALNDHLTPRTFLAGPGPAPSLADLVLAAHLGDSVSRFPAAQVGSHPAIARWYDHLVATSPRGPDGEGLLPAGRLEVGPLVLPVPALSATAAGGGGAADKKKKEGGGAAPAAAVAPAATAASAVAPAAAPKKGKDKKTKEGGDAAAAAAAAAPQPAPAAPSPEDAAVAGLDFRVGRILAAERHPNPDVTSLYVETIDLGEEGGPRTIVSGLAKYLPLDALTGRHVVIVANLKPAKMQGVLSAGMVLCASAGDTVDPIVPPAGAAVGERVLFEGLTDAGPPEPVHKKVGKLFDAASPHLQVGQDGVCRFKGVAFGTSAGPVTSGVVGGMIK